MLRHRVDIPGGQVCPLLSYLPVFPSEVEVGVFSSDAEHMGDTHGISPRAIHEEPSSYCLATIFRPNLQEIFGYFNRVDLETENEPDAFTLCVSPQRPCERGIINRGVSFRPYCPVRPYMGLKLVHLLCREKF